MRHFSQRTILTIAITLLAVGHAYAQPDPNLKPTFGATALKAGFTPDPFTLNLQAGGPIRTNLGGVNTYVAKAPDFSLTYTKGNFPLIIRAISKADTTLLINLPDGTWAANDDGGGGLNPLLRFANPQSGRYDIYVGTFGKDLAPATLIITEIDGNVAVAPPVKPVPIVPGQLADCYLISAGVDNYRNANRLNGCLNDARNMSNALKSQTGYLFGKVQSDILLDDAASAATIMQRFRNFSTQGKAGDLMVLFLSGHGGRTNGNKTWYFLPSDFHPKNFAGTTITDMQILETADSIVKQKKKVAIVIDACFSGQLKDNATSYLNRYQNSQDGGLIIMVSSSATQTSAALGQHSAFAKALADSMTNMGDLNKDGKITISEIQSASAKRTAQLLAQSRITDKQDTAVAWSPSISKDMLLAATIKSTIVDPVKPPPTGVAQVYAGTESLAGFGKVQFSIYPDGRVLMVDARDTVEGVWQKSDQLITLAFFNGSVVYTGTFNGATLSGTATGPSSRQNAKKSWTWTTTQR